MVRQAEAARCCRPGTQAVPLARRGRPCRSGGRVRGGASSMADRAKVLEVLRSGEPVAEACARAGIAVADFRRDRDAYLRAKLPPAREALAGSAAAAVEVVRDRWGIPHVFAGGERDALLGLGYCMARDRLWQLEYLRREALGTLAEL